MNIETKLLQLETELETLSAQLSTATEKHLLDKIKTESAILNLRIKATTLALYVQELHDIAHSKSFTFRKWR